jgi:hypothetical protein
VIARASAASLVVASACALGAVPLGVGGVRAGVGVVSTLLGGILLLVWVGVATARSRRHGMATSAGPAWAIISFFVPFANLWIPVRTVTELAGRAAPWPLAWAWWSTTLLDRALHLVVPQLVAAPDGYAVATAPVTALHLGLAAATVWVASRDHEATLRA